MSRGLGYLCGREAYDRRTDEVKPAARKPEEGEVSYQGLEITALGFAARSPDSPTPRKQKATPQRSLTPMAGWSGVALLPGSGWRLVVCDVTVPAHARHPLVTL